MSTAPGAVYRCVRAHNTDSLEISAAVFSRSRAAERSGDGGFRRCPRDVWQNAQPKGQQLQ
jgi:hypothetical protein